MLTFAVALKGKGVPVHEIAKKLTIKVGKNAGKSPSVASLYRALAEAEDAAAGGCRMAVISTAPGSVAGLVKRQCSNPALFLSERGVPPRSGPPPLRPQVTKLSDVLRRSAADLGCLTWTTGHELLSKSLGLTFRVVIGDVKHHPERAGVESGS
ncbi:hypothetical protein [Streptomyces sp. NPDC088789]|uniref:hypothetical protein n=1 Tax=Streptomyces sp. NPDC088789 TaxID=3365899 RepID=UPI0038007BB3